MLCHQATQTLPKHYWSFKIEIWRGLPHLRNGAIHDTSRRTEKLVQAGIQSYGIPTRQRIYDACFEDDRLTRKSQQEHLIFYNSVPFVWKNNRQRTIALSTTEAELDSFVSCVRSVLIPWGYWKAWDPHSTGVKHIRGQSLLSSNSYDYDLHE